MRKTLRTLSVICLMSLVLSMMPVYATDISTTPELFHDVLNLSLCEDGDYQIQTNTSRARGEVITVYSLETTEVYQTADAELLFMRVSENKFVPAESISINPNDPQVITKIDSCGFSEYLTNDLKAIVENCISGEFTLNSDLTIYIPEENSLTRGVTTQTRYYTGYNNQRYYEELLVCSGTSSTFDVRVPRYGLDVYLENLASSIVKTSLGYIADKVTGNMWTLLSVFNVSAGSPTIPTTQAYEHDARLIENKYIKYTSIIIDGNFYMGSILEWASNYRYQNYVNVPGIQSYDNGLTPWQSYQVKGYYSPDKLAFQNYAYSPYVDRILSYGYKNESAQVTTYVDSMFRYY